MILVPYYRLTEIYIFSLVKYLFISTAIKFFLVTEFEAVWILVHYQI